ncbi:Uncharacterised protein [Klebsiella pneumoniae]|nr:Uncharacterised protein [Klebsiella pneumoniae]
MSLLCERFAFTVNTFTIFFYGHRAPVPDSAVCFGAFVYGIIGHYFATSLCIILEDTIFVVSLVVS